MPKQVLNAFKPDGPSVTVILRVSGLVNMGGAGTTANCVSLGTLVTGLTDFTNLAGTFTRWTIRSARSIMIPTIGFANALPSWRGALALGYFND
jgi:hypothetical protein